MQEALLKSSRSHYKEELEKLGNEYSDNTDLINSRAQLKNCTINVKK